MFSIEFLNSSKEKISIPGPTILCLHNNGQFLMRVHVPVEIG